MNAFGTAPLALGQQGRRIAVIGENQYAWATTYLAVVNGAGVIVPIDRELPEEEIIRCLRGARVSAVAFAESKRQVMRSIADGAAGRQEAGGGQACRRLRGELPADRSVKLDGHRQSASSSRV